MAELIEERIVKARKVHDCMAWIWIEYINPCDLGEVKNGKWVKDWKALRAYVEFGKWGNGKIKPGQKYLMQKQYDSSGRKWSTFRAIPELHEICLKYDVYEYEY